MAGTFEVYEDKAGKYRFRRGRERRRSRQVEGGGGCLAWHGSGVRQPTRGA